MPDALMTRCETKRLYKVNGAKEWRWVEVAVADVASDDAREIRCVHCHGAIKVHKTKADASQEHVRHRSRADADNCQAGRGSNGSIGLSSNPVE